MVKFTVMGFNQSILLSFGLDLVDALILRYFVDFKDSGSMVKETIQGQTYYWINYNSLKEYIPIINIRSNDALRRRLKRLEECKVLQHFTKREKRCFSYYKLGPNYRFLIFNTTKKSQGYHSKVGQGTTFNQEQKIHKQNNSSNKDSNIFNHNNKYNPNTRCNFNKGYNSNFTCNSNNIYKPNGYEKEDKVANRKKFDEPPRGIGFTV